MSAHPTYLEAHAAARELANACANPATVRKSREFGRTVYLVSLTPRDPAKRFGVDATGEVVNPGDPAMLERKGGAA